MKYVIWNGFPTYSHIHMYVCMEVVHAVLLAIKQLTIHLEFVFLSFAFIIYILFYFFKARVSIWKPIEKNIILQGIYTCQPTIYAHAIMTKTI